MPFRTLSFPTRRTLVGFASSLALSHSNGSAIAAETEPATLPSTFPAQAPDMVREMVGASHGNFKRVKELVDAHPSLAKAAVDWGFGDWEDALGAASHVGNRQIAEFLIANGARPTLYSATMLGQLETVKAFLAAQPGAQKIPGPHSISLLAHAKAGGKPAEAVYQFLENLGDAGAPPRAPLSETQISSLTGVYNFGPNPADQIEVSAKNAQLMFTRKGGIARGLAHVGDLAFHPVGAEAVRIRFAVTGSAATLTVHDPGVVLTAKRA